MDQELDIDKEIIDWVKQQPYWVKFVSKELIEGNVIDDKKLLETYKYFWQDSLKTELKEERPTIVFNETNDDKKDSQKTTLQRVENATVNALAQNQKIEFSNNITIVYGSNGSGKTGYIRLFNNTFLSRGEKEMLPNIFSEDQKDPYGSFVFSSTDGETTLEYPKDKGDSLFETISVFDRESVRVHLDDKYQLTFKPVKLDFFENLSSVYDRLKNIIETKSIKCQTLTDFSVNFDSESSVKNFVVGINANTTEESLKNYELTPDQQKELSELETKKQELILLDVNKKIKDLGDLKTNILNVRDNITNISPKINVSERKIIKNTIESIQQKTGLLKKQGRDSFVNENIPNIGNDQWKEFIRSGASFINPKSSGYPKQGDHCPFCWQKLDEDSIKLISRYWELLESTLEVSINTDMELLKRIKIEIERLETDLINKDTVLFKWLNEQHPKIAKKLQKYSKLFYSIKTQLVDNINNIDWVKTKKLPKSFIDLDRTATSIQEEINKLIKNDKTEEIAELNKKIQNLKHRQIFSNLLPSIKELIKNKRIKNAYSICLSNLDTSKITRKHSELYKKIVDDKYNESFRDECNLLDADFGVCIRQTGAKGQSYRQLTIKGVVPDKILSEGEQKVTSIADFITENSLNPNNYGMVFDDPVSSLDIERKEKIASRLVDLSKTKQVIIFTHDAVFLSYLKLKIDSAKIDARYHWIQQNQKKPGIISLDDLPNNQERYKDCQKVQEKCNASKLLQGSEQVNMLISAFGELRTCYEHLVVHKMFNDVIKIWDERISVGRLDSVSFTKEIASDIIEANGRLSRFIEGHLHQEETNGSQPTVEKLQEEINKYNEIKGRLKQNAQQ